MTTPQGYYAIDAGYKYDAQIAKALLNQGYTNFYDNSRPEGNKELQGINWTFGPWVKSSTYLGNGMWRPEIDYAAMPSTSSIPGPGSVSTAPAIAVKIGQDPVSGVVHAWTQTEPMMTVKVPARLYSAFIRWLSNQT
jgi:hypothetical protein